MSNKSYSNIYDNVKNIIENNSPEKAIKKISIMTNPETNSKIGNDKAIELYKYYGNLSVKYDKMKYSNNSSSWNKNVLSNLKTAKNASGKNKNRE